MSETTLESTLYSHVLEYLWKYATQGGGIRLRDNYCLKNHWVACAVFKMSSWSIFGIVLRIGRTFQFSYVLSLLFPKNIQVRFFSLMRSILVSWMTSGSHILSVCVIERVTEQSPPYGALASAFCGGRAAVERPAPLYSTWEFGFLSEFVSICFTLYGTQLRLCCLEIRA